MKKQIFYDLATGEIKGYTEGSVTGVHDHHLIESERLSGDDYYVINGSIVSRPTLPIGVGATNIIVGKTASVITGIPAGATIIHNGETHTADGTAITFTADHVGIYTFLFSFWPYKDIIVRITAEEAS